MKKTLSIFIALLVFAILPVMSLADSTKTIDMYQDGGTTVMGQFTYDHAGPTFNFTFTGYAPVENDWYALVLGEDPYNNPEGTIILDYPRSGLGGYISVSKNMELNTDLKKMQVWLVWSGDIMVDPYYTTITQWIGWHPQYHLFGDKLVHYNFN